MSLNHYTKMIAYMYLAAARRAHKIIICVTSCWNYAYQKLARAISLRQFGALTYTHRRGESASRVHCKNRHVSSVSRHNSVSLRR